MNICLCGAPVEIKKHGECRRCYMRNYMKHLPPEKKAEYAAKVRTSRQDAPPCGMDECEKPRTSRYGLCPKHLWRYRRHGDPFWTELGGSRRLTAQEVRPTTYSSAHNALGRLYGAAKTHPCVGCGNTAAQWAYDRSDPNPLTKAHRYPRGVMGVVEYSLDVSRYVPMCRSCHRDWDIEPSQLWWMEGEK